MPSQEDIQFGEIAMANGMLSQDELRECLNAQQLLERMNMQEDLVTILLKKGYISKDQVEIIFQMQGRSTGPKTIGGYEILDKLGEGGMGIVYKARQINMDRIVALKILTPSFGQNQDYIRRFFREARSAGKLDHPNVVRGIDVGEADGYYYFSMEFVDGETLKEYLDKVGQMNEKAACMVVVQVTKALEHAQEFQIVHRDIKPDNIFLSKNNVVKLGDLGLAKPMGEVSLTQTGIPVGTPCYISPEQALNTGTVDVRSDIYSLGITLYQMLTGTIPYADSSFLEAVTRHVQEELPPIAKLKPNLSPEIVFIVEKMSKKNPNDRFQNPSELLHALLTFIQGSRLAPDGQQLVSIKPAAQGNPFNPTAFDQTVPLQAQAPPQTTRVQAPPQTAGASIPDDLNFASEDFPLEVSDSSSLLIQFDVPDSTSPIPDDIPLDLESETRVIEDIPLDLAEDEESAITTKPMIPAQTVSAPTQNPLKAPSGFPGKKGKKISDRLGQKGRISDGLAKKSKTSDRLDRKTTVHRLPKSAIPTQPPQKGGSWGLLLFLLVLLGGGGGVYFYLEQQKKQNRKNPVIVKSGTNSGRGSQNTHQGADRKPPKPVKDPDKQAFDRLTDQAPLLESQPEIYPSIIQGVRDYLATHPPAQYATKAQTLLSDYQKKFSRASEDKYEEIKERITRDYLPEKHYKEAKKRALELFPKDFHSTVGYEKIERFASQLEKRAKMEFSDIQKTALSLVGLTRFEQARRKINQAKAFGYFQDKIDEVLQKIDQAERDHKRKIAQKKAWEVVRQKFRAFKVYYESNYKYFHKPYVEKRDYESALEQCHRSLQGADPLSIPMLNQDKKWIGDLQKFYKAVKNGADRLASSASEISVQMGQQSLEGVIHPFAGDTFYVKNGAKKVFIDFNKISPEELYSTFLESKEQGQKDNRIALTAMLIFEGDFEKAKAEVDKLRDDSILSTDSMLERLKLLKQYFLEGKVELILARCQKAYNERKWGQVTQLVGQLSQAKFRQSFFLSSHQSQIEQWKTRGQDELRKEPLNLGDLAGHWIVLFYPEKGLRDWLVSDRSWSAKQGLLIGLRDRGWIVKKKHLYSRGGQSKKIPLAFLEKYQFAFQMRVPRWDKVEGEFLEIYLPYHNQKNQFLIYTLLLSNKGIQVKGNRTIWKWPEKLDNWKNLNITLNMDRNKMERMLKVEFQAQLIGSVSLRKVRPSKVVYRQKGLGFFQLIDSQTVSSLEFRKIRLMILK